MAAYTKKEALSVIVDCAARYERCLNNANLLFVLQNRRDRHISYFEATFSHYNYLHLTGIKCSPNITAGDFYKRCLNNRLRTADFEFAPDGTTQLKLEVLPKLMTKNISATMAGDFDGLHQGLYTEKLAGGIKACLGFVRTTKGKFVPNTVLQIDIRQAVKRCLSVIATYHKMATDTTYTDLVYKSKIIEWDKIIFPSSLHNLPRSM